jgi:hypothetical protein
MTSENRERLLDLLHLGRRSDRVHVQRLPDDVVDFFVAKVEELAWRRATPLIERPARELLDERVQSIHDTVTAYDSEGLGSWQLDFDRWHAARAVKH